MINSIVIKLIGIISIFVILSLVIYALSNEIDRKPEHLNHSNKVLTEPSIPGHAKNTISTVSLSIQCAADEFIEPQYLALRADNHVTRQILKKKLKDFSAQSLHEISERFQLPLTEILGAVARQTPPINPRSVVVTELTDIQPFFRLLKSQQYDEITRQLHAGTIPVNAALGGQYLLNWVLQLEPEISADNLTKLLQAGIKINLTTLYTATKAGIDQERMRILLPFLEDGDLSTVWQSNQQFVSLASFAAQMKRPDLSRFWWQQGSPLVSLNSGLNIAFQVPWQELDQDETIEFVNLISEAGMPTVPMYPVDYKILQRILGKQQLELFEPLSEIQTFYSSDWPETERLLLQLQQNQQAMQGLIQCQPDLLEKHKLAEVLTAGDPLPMLLKKIYTEVAADYDPNAPIIEIESALREKNWEKALSLLSHLEATETNADIFNRVYFSMLEGEADFNYLKSYIELFSTPPEFLLLTAAIYGHNQLANLLIEKGADIHATNKDGFSSLQLAAMNAYSAGNQMIDFLLQAGSSPFATHGPDPLSLLLSRAHDRDVAVTKHYIQLFRLHGVTNTDIHKNIVKSSAHLTEANRQKILSWL